MRRFNFNKDPAEVLERAQRGKQLDMAKQIFKLPEAEWEAKVLLLHADHRQPVRLFLERLKVYHKCR